MKALRPFPPLLLHVFILNVTVELVEQLTLFPCWFIKLDLEKLATREPDGRGYNHYTF